MTPPKGKFRGSFYMYKKLIINVTRSNECDSPFL